jgi:hypothetical protein
MPSLTQGAGRIWAISPDLIASCLGCYCEGWHITPRRLFPPSKLPHLSNLTHVKYNPKTCCECNKTSRLVGKRQRVEEVQCWGNKTRVRVRALEGSADSLKLLDAPDSNSLPSSSLTLDGMASQDKVNLCWKGNLISTVQSVQWIAELWAILRRC